MPYVGTLKKYYFLNNKSKIKSQNNFNLKHIFVYLKVEYKFKQ